MCAEELDCLGPRRVVKMLVGNQCNDLVTGRIPGHCCRTCELCAKDNTQQEQSPSMHRNAFENAKDFEVSQVLPADTDLRAPVAIEVPRLYGRWPDRQIGR